MRTFYASGEVLNDSVGKGEVFLACEAMVMSGVIHSVFFLEKCFAKIGRKAETCKKSDRKFRNLP
jgi:hypothetical protein